MGCGRDRRGVEIGMRQGWGGNWDAVEIRIEIGMGQGFVWGSG